MIRLIVSGVLLVLSGCSWLDREPVQSLEAAPFLSAVKEEGGISLQWSKYILGFGSQDDFLQSEINTYHILRSSDGIEGLSRIGETSEASFLDQEARSGSFLYAIEAETRDGELIRSNIVMASGGAAEIRPVSVWARSASIGGYTQLVSGATLVETVNEDGRRIILLGNAQQNQLVEIEGWNPVQHPVEEQFLFIAEADGAATGMKLCLYSVADQQTTELVSGYSFITDPAWNQDGSAITFLSGAGQGQPSVIRILPISGGLSAVPLQMDQSVRYSGGGEPGPEHPVFSPFGELNIIADVPAVTEGAVTRDIYQISLSGDSIVLTSPWLDSHPAVNPTGSHMAFISDRAGYMAIWLLEFASGDLRQLTGAADDPVVSGEFQLRWAMEGSRLWYTGLSGGHQSCYELSW